MSTASAAPLRVLLVTHYYPAHGGGVECVAGELARRLVQAGVARFEWHASDCDPPPALPGTRCIPARSWNASERALGLPYPLWSPASLRQLVRAVSEADIVHVHDSLYLPCLAAALTAARARRPVLVTQHVGFIPYRNPLPRLALAAANRLPGSLVLGRAAQVVFVSETVRAYFARFVRFRADPLLVPNGVDVERFVPADAQRRAALRSRLGAPEDRPLLLFVGRFVEKKGLPVLRELARRLPRTRWVVAGWGPLDPAGWRAPNVTVIDRPDAEEIVQLYQAADLLVLPSAGEGFPLVVQEAMACGTPALVGQETAEGCPGSENVLLREPVGDAATAERWAGRLGALLDSRDLLSSLRPRAAAYAREHWSWNACVTRYAAILQRCAAGR
jgi:glycosyltransferase involved in cell wall biosynthesis